MELPKNFDDRHWWILVSIAGALIAVASAPVKFGPGFAIGIGLLSFGIGQWVDHPIVERIGGGLKVSSYKWRPSFSGISLSLLGGVIFLFGLWRLFIG
jgi:hypothetical protein